MTPIEPGRTLPAKSLELFFDYTCPFAYIGSTQVRALAARMGVPVTYCPILLGGVFRAVGTAQNLSETHSPAKAAHNAADMQRWAKKFGVPLRMPDSHPRRSVDALRATLAAAIDPRVIDAFYRAYWIDNRDIASPEVVAEVLAGAGHDPARILSDASSPAIKDDLRRRTDEAVARGVYGVPTFIVDREHLYWGQDRIELVEGVRRARPEVAARKAEKAEKERKGRAFDFYWDFSSPFSYLASTQIDGLARRTGAAVSWRGILLGGLFRSLGTPEVPVATFSPAKQKNTLEDLGRWAALWEVPFRFPSRFPMRTLDALRLHLALPEADRAGFRERVFRAYWVEDRDIADEAVLASLVGSESVAREALARSRSDVVKAELRAETERATQRGVFGLPAVILDDNSLYWGQDRLGLVEEALLA